MEKCWVNSLNTKKHCETVYISFHCPEFYFIIITTRETLQQEWKKSLQAEGKKNSTYLISINIYTAAYEFERHWYSDKKAVVEVESLVKSGINCLTVRFIQEKLRLHYVRLSSSINLNSVTFNWKYNLTWSYQGSPTHLTFNEAIVGSKES